MQLIKPRSFNDIKYCAELYCDQEHDDFVETNKIVSTNNLVTESRRNFFRVLVEEPTGLPLGWILAYKVPNSFNGQIELQQQFYTSVFTGIKAVKAVQLVHKELIDYAEKYRIPVVLSHCSHNDPTFVLCRILQKEGWMIRGYLAQWRTSWHPKPSAKLSHVVSEAQP